MRIAASAPPVHSRIAAVGALTVALATLAALVVFTAGEWQHVAVALAAGALSIASLWVATTNRRYRWFALAGGLVCLLAVVVALFAAGRGVVAVVIAIVGTGLANGLGTLALRWEVDQALAERWRDVPPTRRGVLLMNPHSGGGKVAKFHLDDEARRRGIEAVLLEPGVDLRALAQSAVTRGADALGMAGGDGSQAVVAQVASEHGLPFVCIPAGTRNHLALDIGIDRDDPIDALGAFGPARETTIDLGEVNGEVFVNNVSLGVYARVVASDAYRNAKSRTVVEMLPDLMGPHAEPSGLSIDRAAGPIRDAQIILVSNNPYEVSSLAGLGSRARLDTGVLGVVAVSISRAADVPALVALDAAGHPERYPGWRQWMATDLVIQGPRPTAAGVDGEARSWDPPLRLGIRPGALRVRIARGQRGASPAFLHAPVTVTGLVGLIRVARGRPSGIVEHRNGGTP